MRAGALILEPFSEALRERVPFAVPEIRFGALGTRAGTLGAAALVLTDFVRDTLMDKKGRLSDAPQPQLGTNWLAAHQ